MSGGEPDARVLSAIITQNYVLSATLALVVYEYVITWQQEARTIWRRKFTVTSVFLVAIRYTMLLAPLAQLVSEFTNVAARRIEACPWLLES
ncbi:hypothetical protein PHLGIDRAFT_401780 [Phlebiopsis gigantea 11061_1 CR5-6]|uniref:DUF6533 domain-containing protein n=1 Tax=Phlebiopsis gigantea (strain 11061_1 CR5-6) TaxID=745531 RepID=A0A0C3PMT1_PHLG1|nr:hypothetical protein PHLGIDRAFT_401780 [Phlebiopsis gigantea 11061_1 CR5-6]